MKRRHYLLVSGLVAIAGAFLMTGSNLQSGPQTQAYKLEGAWVSRVPGFGNQWTTIFVPTDPSGRRAAVWGSLEVPVPPGMICEGVPEFDTTSDYTGEVVMSGPRTAALRAIGYCMYKGQLAMIWTTSGELQFSAPGKGQTTFTLEYYTPDADTNGDGVPEGEPFCTFTCPVPTIDTRIGLALPPAH